MNTTFARLVVGAWALVGVIMLVLGALHLDQVAQLDWVRLPGHAVMLAGGCLAVVAAAWLLYHLVVHRIEEEVVLGLLSGTAGMAIFEKSAIWGLLFLGALIWSAYRRRLLKPETNESIVSTPANTLPSSGSYSRD